MRLHPLPFTLAHAAHGAVASAAYVALGTAVRNWCVAAPAACLPIVPLALAAAGGGAVVYGGVALVHGLRQPDATALPFKPQSDWLVPVAAGVGLALVAGFGVPVPCGAWMAAVLGLWGMFAVSIVKVFFTWLEGLNYPDSEPRPPNFAFRAPNVGV